MGYRQIKSEQIVFYKDEDVKVLKDIVDEGGVLTKGTILKIMQVNENTCEVMERVSGRLFWARKEDLRHLGIQALKENKLLRMKLAILIIWGLMIINVICTFFTFTFITLPIAVILSVLCVFITILYCREDRITSAIKRRQEGGR